MSAAPLHDYAGVGLIFATALARRDYTAAYALTSSEYQRNTTIAEMRAAFETIVPTDWRTVGPVEVGVTHLQASMMTLQSEIGKSHGRRHPQAI
jgi:hypothetical protein